MLMLVLIPQVYSYTNVNDKSEPYHQCYQCTTHQDALQSWHEGKDIPVDSVCGDPLIEGSRGGEEPPTKKYLKKCPDSSDYCEKTTVHVEGKDQIVRSCLKQEAKNFREGCNFDKSNVQKCECSGDACNGAEIAKIISPLTATLVSAVLAVMLK